MNSPTCNKCGAEVDEMEGVCHGCMSQITTGGIEKPATAIPLSFRIVAIVHAFPDDGRRDEVRSLYFMARALEDRVARLEDLLAYVRKEVTVEVAAYGSCDCNALTGEVPCPTCASVYFNKQTEPNPPSPDLT